MFWENYSEGELLIARSIWNGITTDPKSRKSKAPIPIIPKLAAKLEAHRAILGKPKVGPIFPNGAGNAIDPDSLLRRAILRRLRSAKSVASQNPSMGEQHTNMNATRCWRGADGMLSGAA